MQWQQGQPKTYRRTADSQRWVEHLFCEHCGTTVGWQAEAMKDNVAIAVGTLDQTDWASPKFHAWTVSSQAWFPFEFGAPCYETTPSAVKPSETQSEHR